MELSFSLKIPCQIWGRNPRFRLPVFWTKAKPVKGQKNSSQLLQNVNQVERSASQVMTTLAHKQTIIMKDMYRILTEQLIDSLFQ